MTGDPTDPTGPPVPSELTAALAQRRSVAGTRLADQVIRDLHGERLDFGRVEYVNVTFEDCELAGSDFTRAYLKGCVFRNVNLARTRWCEAYLADCLFERANLHRADLWAASFVQCELNGCWTDPGEVSRLDRRKG
jgi:uncharacterized protein YjbI with pentapeptide repeats